MAALRLMKRTDSKSSEHSRALHHGKRLTFELAAHFQQIRRETWRKGGRSSIVRMLHFEHSLQLRN